MLMILIKAEETFLDKDKEMVVLLLLLSIAKLLSTQGMEKHQEPGVTNIFSLTSSSDSTQLTRLVQVTSKLSGLCFSISIDQKDWPQWALSLEEGRGRDYVSRVRLFLCGLPSFIQVFRTAWY